MQWFDLELEILSNVHRVTAILALTSLLVSKLRTISVLLFAVCEYSNTYCIIYSFSIFPFRTSLLGLHMISPTLSPNLLLFQYSTISIGLFICKHSLKLTYCVEIVK